MRHAIAASKFVASKTAASKQAPSLPNALDADSLAADAQWLKCAPPQLDLATAQSLQEILPSAEFFSGSDVKFSSIASDVNSAEAGQLVVYRIGQDDPMKLLSTAMARGAAGILTEQVLPCPLPQCIVSDTEQAIDQITSGLLGNPDQKLLTIGVIGSAGKTTTSLLISSLLRSNGSRTAYQTDLGDCDGIVQSTPAASNVGGSHLIQWLADAVDGQCQTAVVELNDDAARLGKYDATQFDVLVITGTASVASDFGPSALQCMLERLKPAGVVIAPADDTKALQVLRDSNCRVTTYAMQKPADLTASIFEQSGGMTTLMITQGDTSALLETALCGAANAKNHLAAAAVGILLDQPLQQIVQSLSALRAVPGRGQRFCDIQHATAIVDVAGTPQRASTSLQTARSMRAGGQLWCVLAIDENDTPETLAHYGQLLERYAGKCIVTSNQSSKSSFLAASHHLLDGVEHCAAMRLVAAPKRAIQWAINEAAPRDTILVLGGVDTSTAHQQRTEIQQIKNWIEQERQSKEERWTADGTDASENNPNIIPINSFKK
ncbi:Mur ligase family protein [Planctomycetes bacterium K23_9]|uniref:MurE-like ligase n=1 Tax=Stieleria marina TaxID=1930275 RepID=A0A517NTG7_9BACT|nr:MurE-like ligase [Planctomycetes bacterium K23_9]